MFISFDFDGTLADTFSIFRDAFDDAAAELHTTPYRRRDEAHIRTLEVTDVLHHHDVQEKEFPAFTKLLRAGMERRYQQVSLFPGITEMLNALHSGGHTLALVSSNSHGLVEGIMGRILDSFDVKITDVGLKSKTEILQKLFATAPINMPTLYVGDELRDLRAAQDAGVNFAAVVWGYNTEDSLRRAGSKVLLRHPAEIIDLANKSRSV